MPDFEPTIVLATLIACLVLFVTDALRYELVALLAVIVLAVTGCLTTEEAFAGFGAPATITVASMYVFAEAVTRWGVAQAVGQRVILSWPQSEAFVALKIVGVAGLLSTVLSDTAVTACLMPVVTQVARQARLPVSRLLIPLSFASLLAGTVTVMGTSTNVAINSVLAAGPEPPFALFEFAPIGLALLLVGALYFFGPGRWLLPKSRVDETLSEHYHVPKFVTEVLVEPSSTLINHNVSELGVLEQAGVAVVGIVRAGGEGTLLAPGPYNRIRRDDTLILQGEPEAILRLRAELGLKQRESVVAGGTRLDSADVLLIEAVVPRESALAGRTLVESDFRARTNLNVLAIAKHGDLDSRQIGKARLRAGDTLLIQGHKRDVERLRATRELVFLGEIEQPPIGPGVLITLSTLLAVLTVTALGWLELALAALLGAVVLVLLRVLKAGEALRAIDWSVIVLIGGMLAVGNAFERHGLARTLADWMIGMGSAEADPQVMLAMLMLCTLLLSQIVANVSAGVIMTPVALSLAGSMGLEPRPFVLAVLFGASCVFMSPIAHQANTMVTGPGGYRFRDFVRVGTPLTVFVVVVTTLLVPIFFPFRAG